MATEKVKRLTMEFEDGRVVELAPTDAFHRVSISGPAGLSERGDGHGKNDYFTHEVRWTAPLPPLGDDAP